MLYCMDELAISVDAIIVLLLHDIRCICCICFSFLPFVYDGLLEIFSNFCEIPKGQYLLISSSILALQATELLLET